MSKVVPFSLKDAPSLIEKVFPAQKVSVETKREFDAHGAQTLTPLGSYWKGRKRLVYVRACALAAILPATGDDLNDLAILDLLMGMSDQQIRIRLKYDLTVEDIRKYGTENEIENLVDKNNDKISKSISPDEKIMILSTIISRMPYQERVNRLLRPEEIAESDLTGGYIDVINSHYGTCARDIFELIEQIGVMRFGRKPIIGDTFSGSGSIPFESARLGFDVYASDLNPIACLLTWGALNVVGSDAATYQKIVRAQKELSKRVDSQISDMGIEHDAQGNRAKAYFYCVEVRCPKTGWFVPLAQSWVISRNQRTVAILEPSYSEKRYIIKIKIDASDAEIDFAERGTFIDGNVIHTLDGETYSTPIKIIRGDRKGEGGENINDLRRWGRSDFVPRPDDIFQERLYCIQWMKKETLHKRNPETYFASVAKEDLDRERVVEDIVRKNIAAWQDAGLIPDMLIEPGSKTDEPIRTRGWTYWHHLFNARHLIIGATILKNIQLEADFHVRGALYIGFARSLNYMSKLTQWMVRKPTPKKPADVVNHVFYNQALNTFYNYGSRALNGILPSIEKPIPQKRIVGISNVMNVPASEIRKNCDIFITDPPYADAVNYHEITEYFISWLRSSARIAFPNWLWDSRRPLAIKGDGEEFKKAMIESYHSMADQMPDNGLQIVMFTHQDTDVWADMAQIFWGAGLRVISAWYVATEVTSETKKGGYVQGTVTIVLRKRLGNESGYKDEIVQEVKSEVAEQIDTMVGLNQTLKGSGRIENLFEDADLQMAGYAAALRVLTRYTKIDGTDMTKEALRPRVRGEKSLVNEIVEYAVQVANEHMVPEGISTRLWEGLGGSERFYLKMVDIESVGLRKLDNYQNFAKAFRVDDFQVLMGKMEANGAHLKSAKDFKKSVFEGSEFATSTLRALLYAIYRIGEEVEGDQVLSELRELIPTYMTRRDDLMEMAGYLSKQWLTVNEGEARSAEIVRGLIKNERFG